MDDVIRDAVHEAWRLGMGTAIGLVELHHRAGTPIEKILDELRARSAQGIGRPEE